MEFNDGFPSYETIAQHDDETGKVVRKKLMAVFWLLLIVTLIEIGIGFMWPTWEAAGVSKTFLIIGFVAFTLVKAGYIVMTFMHLGDENALMRWSILGAYCAFVVYLVYMTSVTEGTYAGEEDHRTIIDPAADKQVEAPAPAHH